MHSKFEIIYSHDNIIETASNLLNHFNTKKIFCFKGNLGAGKTTFISAICKILGSKNIISSPTFSIVNEYNSENGIIYHFDLYRLKNLEEAMDIGFEEYIYSKSYCFIEWPEKVLDILPNEFVVTCDLSYLSLKERRILAWEK